MEWIIIGIAVVSVLFGYIVGKLEKAKTVGVLMIDNSDPNDDPYLFLKLKAHPDEIRTAKYVTLQVDASRYISHE